MHEYRIIKHISPKKQDPFRVIINFFILLIAIPVVIISVISLLLYFFSIWLISFFIKNKRFKTTTDHYRQELELLNNEYVKIILVEDEIDIELSGLNELWMDIVYDRETLLYRAKTLPYIEELEGGILGFYVKEQQGGAILQVLSKTHANENGFNSQLVFLNYQDLKVSVIEQIGNYYLYNDEKNASLILGFNKKEKIRMEIIRL